MHGDGTLTVTKVGNYEYWTVRYYDNSGNRKTKRFPHTEDGKRAAKKFHNSIKAKKTKGELITTTRTVAAWCEEFIATYKMETLRKNSIERLRESYKKIEVAPFANVPLDKLDAAMVQNYYNLLGTDWKDEYGKAHKALSSSSISKVHKLLVSAFKRAVQNGYIAKNPMVSVDPVKVHTKEMSVFTWREVGRIFRAIRKITGNKHNSKQRYDYRLLFMMLLECGMRISELLALTWQDINFQKREIHIHTSKQKGVQEFNAPKTKAGTRYIPIISDKLLERLKDYRQTDGIIKMQGFVFETANKGAIDYRRVLSYWQQICKLAGINKSIHTFRHTFATYLLERGIPVAEVSRILGHADATITYGMYVHSIPNYNQTIIDQLSKKKTTKASKKKAKGNG